jgi:hypothetical protein
MPMGMRRWPGDCGAPRLSPVGNADEDAHLLAAALACILGVAGPR